MSFGHTLPTVVCCAVLVTSPVLAAAEVDWGLVADLRGRIWIADRATDRVWRVDGQDRMREVPAAKRPRTALLSGLLTGALIDAAGHHYRADAVVDVTSRIVRHAPDGSVHLVAGNSWGRMDGRGEEAMFQGIAAMTWGPQGDIFVTDEHSVRRVRLDGTVSTLVVGIGGEPDAGIPSGVTLRGLTVAADGTVYLADCGQRRVLKLSADGATSTLARVEPPWSPTAIALSRGRLVTLEFAFTEGAAPAGPRLRRQRADGSWKVLGEDDFAPSLGR